MGATSQHKELFEDYDGFVEKFKPKKTTDDCYTPPEIYEVIKQWACREYGIDASKIVRPFYPGGDFEHYDYPDGCCVLDNPPFSILSKIVAFYIERNIDFFLFAPTLTLLNARGGVLGAFAQTLTSLTRTVQASTRRLYLTLSPRLFVQRLTCLRSLNRLTISYAHSSKSRHQPMSTLAKLLQRLVSVRIPNTG